MNKKTKYIQTTKTEKPSLLELLIAQGIEIQRTFPQRRGDMPTESRAEYQKTVERIARKLELPVSEIQDGIRNRQDLLQLAAVFHEIPLAVLRKGRLAGLSIAEIRARQ